MHPRPTRSLTAVVPALLAVLLATLLAPPSSASFSGREGLIAFVRGGNIYTATASGGSVKQVTRTNDLSGPRWSPDGKSLAYKNDAGVVSVRTMSTGKTVVLGVGATSNPVWSPNGARVAWSARNPDADDCEHTQVVMTAYATLPSVPTILMKPVNECPYESTMKLGSWASDNQMSLSFCGSWQTAACAISEWDTTTTTRLRFLANVYCSYEGEEDATPQVCTSNVSISPGNYSPDQKRVLFSGHGRNLPGSNPIQPAGAQDVIWVVDRTGSNLGRMSTAASGYSPTWSPTGKSILFTQKSGSTTNIMKSGVTAASTATVLIKNASQADWQPVK